MSLRLWLLGLLLTGLRLNLATSGASLIDACLRGIGICFLLSSGYPLVGQIGAMIHIGLWVTPLLESKRLIQGVGLLEVGRCSMCHAGIIAGRLVMGLGQCHVLGGVVAQPISSAQTSTLAAILLN